MVLAFIPQYPSGDRDPSSKVAVCHSTACGTCPALPDGPFNARKAEATIKTFGFEIVARQIGTTVPGSILYRPPLNLLHITSSAASCGNRLGRRERCRRAASRARLSKRC
jgi:hypothetical protein